MIQGSELAFWAPHRREVGDSETVVIVVAGEKLHQLRSAGSRGQETAAGDLVWDPELTIAARGRMKITTSIVICIVLRHWRC